MPAVLPFEERRSASKAQVQLRAAERRKELLRSPVGFAKGALGHSIWGKQAEIMTDIATERRVAVKSCHASGKTFGCADIALWWVTTSDDAIAVTTAPTWVQVDQLLWGEIRNTVGHPNTKIKYPRVNTTELKIGEKNYAIGLSTNQANRFQGFHSGRVLIIVDEAPGVRGEIFEAINGLRAGGDVRELLIGNPVIVGGEFHEAFTTKRDLWKTHTISAFDTPNLRNVYLEYPDPDDEAGQRMIRHGRGKNLLELTEEELDRNVRPYLCTRRWVKEMFAEWGPTHPYFQSRVLGDFPSQGDDALIPLSWLEKAKLREAKTDPKDEVRAGLSVMQGDRVMLLKAWPQADPRGEIVAALMPWKEELASLNVDSIGVGWGIYLHLKDVFGAKVHAVNVGDAPTSVQAKKKFANAKAEFYWSLRLRVQAGELLGLTDEKAIGQLSVIKYRHNERGKIEIESKQELTRRGVKSPDRAEALMLCNARSRQSGFFSLPMDRGGSEESGEGWKGGGWGGAGGSNRFGGVD